jgi:hypothetical protein
MNSYFISGVTFTVLTWLRFAVRNLDHDYFDSYFLLVVVVEARLEDGAWGGGRSQEEHGEATRGGG